MKRLVLALAACLAAGASASQPVAEVLDQARAQKEPFLQSLKSFVEIESGSADREGLDRLAELVAAKFRATGAEVALIETPEAEIVRSATTPPKPGRILRATFRGKGTKKILLIAHMDTVYQKGDLAKQPFRIDGNRVFGLGIGDDKQGIATILHAIEVLRALKFEEFGTLTALINADEEIGSPASRRLLAKLGAEHDATMSFEGSGITNDRLSLTTAGIASVTLTVQGRSSHAGSSPHLGVNALYEMAHQVLNMRDLSDPATGTKLNWTVAQSGTVTNVIPDAATAKADVRVLKVSDYDVMEAKVRERVKNQLLADAKVTYTFTKGRPPLTLNENSRRLALHSARLYKDELGRDLKVEDEALGGGTDAAYAALETKNPVVERYGVRAANSHSSNAEYIALDDIEPRLYLVARTIMDIARGKVN